MEGGLWRISISAHAGSGTPRRPGANAATPDAAGAPSVAMQLEQPAAARPPPRSIFGLPILSCRNRLYMHWCLFILLLDLTYSAWLLPLSIGFHVRACELRDACTSAAAAHAHSPAASPSARALQAHLSPVIRPP